MVNKIYRHWFGLPIFGLVMSLALVACGDATSPTTSSGATTVAATTRVATTVAATTAAQADGAKNLTALKTVGQNLTDADTALQKGDLAAAKTAYQKFEASWDDVETPIKAQSKDLYAQIEDDMTGVGRELIRSTSPAADKVKPFLASLIQHYNAGVSLVEKASTSTAPKAATISGPEADAATAKISDYMKGKADTLVKDTTEFVTAVKAHDLAKAKTGYTTARYDYESIEFLAESFKEMDVKIDGRPDDFPQGEQDPQWSGFHALEKAIYVDGRLDDRTDKIADQLVKDVSSLRDEIKKLEITPTTAISGAMELVEEIQSSKITGEEERYSHTDLNDFKANLQSARFVYDSYASLLKQRDATLADNIQANFSDVEKSIANYFTPDGTASDYSKLDDKTRKVVAQKVEGLADNFSRVAGTLGIQAQG